MLEYHLLLYGRLVDDVGVRLQELQDEAVAHPALVVEGVEQGVVPEGGPPLVHDLGLALGVEVLGDLADDAHHLPLPGLQQGGVLLDEVEEVLLGLLGEALLLRLRRPCPAGAAGCARVRSPGPAGTPPAPAGAACSFCRDSLGARL